MFQWQIDLANAKRKFEAEMDAAQDECYSDFLARLGLEHTETVWNAFVEVWVEGEAWGQDREYSYPN